MIWQEHSEQNRKVIAVTNEIVSHGVGDRILRALRQILIRCGLGDRYLVCPESDLCRLQGDWTPFALVAESLPKREIASIYRVCISEYQGAQLLGEIPCRCTTFSTENDGADFVAKNVRTANDGISTFDLEIRGVVSRIRFPGGSNASLRAALIAAASSLSCGISVDLVSEVLNSFPH